MALRKRAVILAFALTPILFMAWVATRPDQYHTHIRRAWKDSALADMRISLSNETKVKEALDKKLYDDNAWLGESFLHFGNGEWILYRSCCHKQDAGCYDLFLGRGSDGTWYYSTFHFCVNMCVLQMQGPCESLDAFKKNYALKSFDGISEVCLEPTWPAAR